MLPILFPALPMFPVFLYLTVLSMRLQRPYLLACALWAGLVQDVLVGQILGLSMLTNFVAMFVIWELKDSLLENTIMTCGLRLVVATLVQELLMGFLFYIRGLEPDNLLFILQINTGITLLSNLLLYFLFLALLRLRGQGKIAGVLGVEK